MTGYSHAIFSWVTLSINLLLIHPLTLQAPVVITNIIKFYKLLLLLLQVHWPDNPCGWSLLSLDMCLCGCVVGGWMTNLSLSTLACLIQIIKWHQNITMLSISNQLYLYLSWDLNDWIFCLVFFYKNFLTAVHCFCFISWICDERYFCVLGLWLSL